MFRLSKIRLFHLSYIAATAVIGLVLHCTAVAEEEVRDATLFSTWRQSNAADVEAFRAHLEAFKVSSVVGLDELLRSASSWRSCKAQPYAIPPREQWQSVVSVLKLLQELRTQKILSRFVVHSAYRNAELNLCAGGASRSAHFRSFAVDITPIPLDDTAAKLCDFWRKNGRSWNMGFGQYASGRLHIDTSRYRTWGAIDSGTVLACG